MAQRYEDRLNQHEKVAIRLERPRAAASVEPVLVPANAVLDADGRVVPMRAVTIRDDVTEGLCNGSGKLRPADVRVIAAREAEAIKLPLETLNAVLRAEGQLGLEGARGEGNAAMPRITPTSSSTNKPCAEVTAMIQRGVGELQALRQRHPNPLHHFAAYRDGEETFIASGGVPRSHETLRFVVTAMNELAGPVTELPAIVRSTPPQKDQLATREPVAPRSKERSSPSPDPRWASGFVFNLE